MKRIESIAVITSIILVVGATLYVYYLPIVEAQQLRYNLDEPVIHIKFFSSNDTDDLSFQINKFIVNKTFDSSWFELQSIEVIEFDTTLNLYSVMITYKDLNEESPDRGIADLEDRIARTLLENQTGIE